MVTINKTNIQKFPNKKNKFIVLCLPAFPSPSPPKKKQKQKKKQVFGCWVWTEEELHKRATLNPQFQAQEKRKTTHVQVKV